MTQLLIVLPTGEPFEYWCDQCRQLRLCCDSPRETCGHCGAPITVKGAPGELDAEKLKGAA